MGTREPGPAWGHAGGPDPTPLGSLPRCDPHAPAMLTARTAGSPFPGCRPGWGVPGNLRGVPPSPWSVSERFQPPRMTPCPPSRPRPAPQPPHQRPRCACRVAVRVRLLPLSTVFRVRPCRSECLSFALSRGRVTLLSRWTAWRLSTRQLLRGGRGEPCYADVACTSLGLAPTRGTPGRAHTSALGGTAAPSPRGCPILCPRQPCLGFWLLRILASPRLSWSRPASCVGSAPSPRLWFASCRRPLAVACLPWRSEVLSPAPGGGRVQRTGFGRGVCRPRSRSRPRPRSLPLARGAGAAARVRPPSASHMALRAQW